MPGPDIVGDIAASAPAKDRDRERFEQEESKDGLAINSVSSRLTSVEEVLRFAKTDRAVWEVEKHTLNSWETAAKVERNGEWKVERTTLFQVKVWLRRRVAKPLADGIALVAARLRSHDVPVPTPPRRKKHDRYLAEIGLHDVHLGKLCWGRETGTPQDTKSQERVYLNAVADCLERLKPYPLERIVLPIGSDFFQVDNWLNTTAAGTAVDHDGRFPRVFAAGVMAVKAAASLCLAAAPVEMIWVPGNHDPATSYYLALAVQQFFEGAKAKRVTFDVSPSPRKYVEHGTCLIGYTHGKYEKPGDLPALMATEKPEAWGRTTCREWRLGDKHHKKRWVTQDIGESQGVRSTICPSLSGTDSWHHSQGYVGSRRCVEVSIWHREEGYVGHLNVNAREG